MGRKVFRISGGGLAGVSDGIHRGFMDLLGSCGPFRLVQGGRNEMGEVGRVLEFCLRGELNSKFSVVPYHPYRPYHPCGSQRSHLLLE